MATKRRKLNGPKKPKPKPRVETANALSLEEFWALYRPIHEETTHSISAGKSDSKEQLQNGSKEQIMMPFDDMALVLSDPNRLSFDDFSACFSLIEQLNQDDYATSSLGWNPRKKKAEMQLPDLKYLLLKNQAEVSRMRTSSQPPPSSKSPQHDNQKEVEQHAGNDDEPDHSSTPPILGFISFMITYEDSFEVVYLYEIHLHQTMQGRGLGPKLIHLIQDIGQNVGVEKAMLTVFRSNERARRTYEKLGWSEDEYSPQPRKMRNGVVKVPDYLIMSKQLQT